VSAAELETFDRDLSARTWALRAQRGAALVAEARAAAERETVRKRRGESLRYTEATETTRIRTR
jgi:hypothetical protein